MNQFLFPANPADGDVVIRMVDGTQIKGTYNASTNTWEVGELPEEPGVPGPQGPKGDQGDKGDPGQGLQVSGAVANEASLPPANDHYLQFWVTDDTNTLYYSDGNTWTNLGSPIQGPQGDGLTSVVANDDGVVYTITFDGTLPQFNFTTPNLKGANGAPGKGWYDTTIIDERPSSYKINFQSNDGLGFVTDNIMGPKGEAGSLQVASETNLGGIKIGRGLDIAPDGTASAGITTVNLETTPVSEGGLAVTYAPIFIDLGENKNETSVGSRNDYTWVEDSQEATMPPGADGAFMFYFSSTSCTAAAENQADPPGVYRAFRAYIINSIDLTNAVFQAGRTSTMAHVHYHNLTIPQLPGLIDVRQSILPLSKINEINFEPGATINFAFRQELYRTGGTTVGGGTARIAIFPFRRSDPETDFAARNALPRATTLIDDGGFYYLNRDEAQDELDELFPPISPEEESLQAADELKDTIRQVMQDIDINLHYVTELEQSELIGYRDTLYNARNIPGTPEDVYNYIAPAVEGVNAITNYTFRFEV